MKTRKMSHKTVGWANTFALPTTTDFDLYLVEVSQNRVNYRVRIAFLERQGGGAILVKWRAGAVSGQGLPQATRRA